MARARVAKTNPAVAFDAARDKIPKFKSTKRRHDEPPSEVSYFYIETEGEPHDHSPRGQQLLVLGQQTGSSMLDRRVHHVGAENEAEAREVVEGIEQQVGENAEQFGEPVTIDPWKIIGVRGAPADGSVTPDET